MFYGFVSKTILSRIKNQKKMSRYVTKPGKGNVLIFSL